MELAKQNNQLSTIGRLNKIPENDFKIFLLKEYNKLLLKNGQNAPDPANAAIVVNELYTNLNRIWPGIKAEWISEAFSRGINGDYGKFANISYRAMVYWIQEYKYKMKAGDFGVKEDPMPTKERASFVLDGLRKRNSDITKLDNKGKEALKRKLNKN